MRYKYLLVLFLLVKTVVSQGQIHTVHKGTELQELVRIAQLYANIPYLSFDMQYTYADSLTWHDLTDSMFASCKLSYGKSLVTNDEMEYLQGKEYNVFVDKTDSNIMAYRHVRDETVLQAPLLDPVFLKGNVDSLRIAEIDDSTWRLLAFFKPESFYSYYELNYDPSTGFVKSVNYHGKNYQGGHDIPSDHVVCATIYMTNYSMADQDPTLFNESRFFYRLNGKLYLQPAWDQYHFENY